MCGPVQPNTPVQDRGATAPLTQSPRRDRILDQLGKLKAVEHEDIINLFQRPGRDQGIADLPCLAPPKRIESVLYPEEVVISVLVDDPCVAARAVE